MTSRVVTSWMAVFGTAVDSSAFEITFEIAMNDSVDSFPPKNCEQMIRTAGLDRLTFKYCRVARLDSKRSNICDDFWASLKDNEKHTNRT